jgi:uncharacterized repeat protein (TIGR03803 family)
MRFCTPAARTNGGRTSTDSRRKHRARTIALDRLESRVLLSASNFGYSYNTIASFSSSAAQAHGPAGAMVRDSNGDFFGATQSGGANDAGAIFEIPAGTGTVQTLVSFDPADGELPLTSGLTIDSAGNLYGTTSSGGADGNGVVFEVPESDRNTIAVLGSFGASFTHGNTVTIDSSGDVFGTTENGGTNSTGSIWEIPAGSSEVPNVGAAPTTIASFASHPSNNTTGASPDPSSILLLHNGTLYGTTDSGGTLGDGVIFSVPDTGGSITKVGSFPVPGDCQGSLVMDGSGDIFGASATGGNGDGYIFEFEPLLNEVLDKANFNGTDGESPVGTVYLNGSGDLFGSTSNGGTGNNGTVYEMFTSGPNADNILTASNFTSLVNPSTGIIADSNGDLFGATSGGGTGSTGGVFELTPVHLVLTGVPGLFSVSPNTISPTVTLEGPTGTTITNDDSLVTLTLSGGTVINNTAMSSAGIATFPDLTVTTPGSGFTLTASDANSDVTAVSGSFNVAPQPVNTSSHLVFLTEPVFNDGAIPTLTVGIKNLSGQLATTDDSIITLTEAGGPASLGGTLSVQAVDGVANFADLTANEAGIYKLTASDGALTAATSKTFTVVAVPTVLVIVSGPSEPLTAGVPSTEDVVVRVDDQFGNVLTHENAAVDLVAFDGPGTPISLGTAKMVNNLATFKNIKIDTAGNFKLGVSADGLQATFEGVEVEPGAGANLAFVLGPPDTTAGAAFSVGVKVLDLFGNLATGDDSQITLSLASGSAGTLSGTTTVAASDGVANFGGLSVSAPGKYEIVATDASLKKSVHTASFIVA